ncbi:histidine kinase [Xanthomonas vasicola pv. musacearum NCPPB 2005]|uniref:CHASE domain-containing hybrid sensor histidine kinase/response regulator n=1 Tax=Xanthomonas vasicola TaxID=56459 RepID=UPI00034A3329|nr:CHASE domain-containing protein [Xanthomonas vasicola]KFA05632.1 histidine kinase [Xanthomonas vasicola pv. musacearum NCPPB 2005]MBV6744089.1 response regulator [Xanthomonas vasicola pv. musacearum NCPPB 2251]MBV7291632.1 response regulator [Xanthomonas vasicola pv. musacearum]RJN19707.1 hybrid sensor histidine kinase/response regulator [Xanthomonas vasicola]
MPKGRWDLRRIYGRRAFFGALLILIAGLIAAITTGVWLQRHNELEREQRFQYVVRTLARNISERMSTFEHGLRGARGAVIGAGSGIISRERFTLYSRSRDYPHEFPGVLGYGYIHRVAPADEDAFLQAARADGAPDIHRRPLAPWDGERYMVLYFEPESSGNRPLGIDIASEPRRRAAALQAARSGEPIMTSPISLSGYRFPSESGFLVLLAIYREGMPLQTPQQRMAATSGWVYAPFSVEQMVQSALGERDEVALDLSDRNESTHNFYRSGTPANDSALRPPVVQLLPMYGRTWVITAHPTASFLASLNQNSPWLIGGLVMAGAVLFAALLVLYFSNGLRREEVLRKQMELAALVSHSSEAIVAETPDGHITHWNPAAEAMFGYTAEEAIDQDLTMLLSPQPYAMPEVDHADAALAGNALAAQTMRHRDGHQVYVLASKAPIIESEGTLSGHSHFFRDISERVRSHQRIIDLNASLEHQVAERTSELVKFSVLQRAILAHAGYAIIATDSSGFVTLFNPAAEKLLGYSAAEVIGRRKASQFIEQDELQARAHMLADQTGTPVAHTLEAIAALTSLGRSDTSEWTYVSHDGRRLPVLLTLSTLRDDHDQVIGYLGVAVDLTEQKLHEKQLRLAMDAAKSANQSKSDFLANMSHEIRTPMNAILGMLYLLQRSELPGAAQEMVTKIDRSARALLEIINDILDFSKIEAGRIDLERAPFDLNQLFDNIADLMRSSLSAKPVEMIVEPLPRDSRWLLGDALRINQVLVNLVGNAIKFTEQGEVVLSVRRFPSGDPNKLKLLFSVRDTGIGISKEKQSLIFSPFLQADTSTSRRYGGSGLGLTISRRLVELMGGELEVESVPGRGSEFYFVITLEKSAPPQAQRELPALPPEAMPRVLIADDHDAALNNLVRIATELGWRVDAVASGQAALQAIEQAAEPYDIFLLDWRMPDIDGVAIAREIRARAAPSPHPVIVMVTAYERRLLELHPEQQDLDAVLTKPVTGPALHRLVEQLVDERPGARPTTPTFVARRLEGAHLLLVDDSEINCEVAQRILEGEGAMVTVAHDGEQAVSTLKRAPNLFHLVLMDVQMPVVDGYEATRRLRQTPALASLPVIALTAGAFRPQQEKALEAGMNGFIAKPFNVEELVTAIRHFLQPGTRRIPSLPYEAEVSAGLEWEHSEPELLDAARARSLWREREPYARYLIKLLRDNPAPAEVAAEHLRRNELPAIGAMAHKLRGAAGSLALPALAGAAGDLEMRIDEGHDITASLIALKDVMQRTAEAIRAFLQHGDSDIAVEEDGVALDADSVQILTSAFASDNADQIDHALLICAPRLPRMLQEALQRAVEDFDFRRAETTLRDWQTTHLH